MDGHIATQLARKLVDRLPEEMADSLRMLIARGEKDHSDPTTEIIELLSQHENSLLWFLEQMELLSGPGGETRGFSSLPGDSSAQISNQWVCPNKACAETLPVIQEGEPAPRCARHKIGMVRGNRERG